MLLWLRRSFIAGFFVTVPLVVSVVAIVWVFRLADRLTSGIGERLFGQPWPGIGIIVTALIILVIGALTANVFGQRWLRRSEDLLLHVPLFRLVYAPVKQLLSAFSPDNEVGFKRMVLVQDQARGAVLGFLTKEFTVDRGHGPETAPGGLRADQSPVPGRHRDLRAGPRESTRTCRSRTAFAYS